MSFSQDITLSGGQTSFSFGNYEVGRAGGQGVEAGRRDNEAGLADDGFDMDAIADPLKDMNLNDNNNNGIMNDAVDFDFDLNDNIDYNAPDYTDGMDEFHFPQANDAADASLDTLMHVGIVEDDSMFDMEGITSAATEPVRRRKRLVVDKITEIPEEDLRRYAADSRSIVQKVNNSILNLDTFTKLQILFRIQVVPVLQRPSLLST